MNTIKENEILITYLAELQSKYQSDAQAAVYDPYTQDEENNLFPILEKLFVYNDSVAQIPILQGLGKHKLGIDKIRGIAIQYSRELTALAERKIEEDRQEEIHTLWHKKKVLDLTAAELRTVLLDTLATAKSQGLI